MSNPISRKLCLDYVTNLCEEFIIKYERRSLSKVLLDFPLKFKWKCKLGSILSSRRRNFSFFTLKEKSLKMSLESRVSAAKRQKFNFAR